LSSLGANPLKKDRGACHLKRSTAGTFVVSFRVLSWRKFGKRYSKINWFLIFPQNWYLLKVEKTFRPRPQKRTLVSLRVFILQNFQWASLSFQYWSSSQLSRYHLLCQTSFKLWPLYVWTIVDTLIYKLCNQLQINALLDSSIL